MGMGHIEEFKAHKTISGWSEQEAENNENYFIRLMLKDVRGKTSLTEKIMIEIDGLLSYNNIDHVPDKEIRENAENIIKKINGEKLTKDSPMTMLQKAYDLCKKDGVELDINTCNAITGAMNSVVSTKNCQHTCCNEADRKLWREVGSFNYCPHCGCPLQNSY